MNVSPGAALVHHLLVELADARTALAEEHAVQPAVRDRPGVHDRHDARIPPRRDHVRLAVPEDARPQVGELVRRVLAREHAEHAFELIAAQRREVVAAPHERLEVIDCPVIDGAHRHDLLREHVERVAWHRPSLRSAPRASARPPPRTRAGRRGTSGRCGRVLGASTWWPARPTRCSPRATDFGDSTWMTRSTAPMSMPSSSELVQTRPGNQPRLQPLFDLHALLARDRAVVRAQEFLARQLVHAQRDPLGQAAVVHEDQRRRCAPSPAASSCG